MFYQNSTKIMKKFLNFSSIYLMALALIVFSCSDDEGDPPPPAPDPVADFSYAVDDENPYLINFTNESENHEASSWDFGDGNTSTDENPSHEYEASGSYEVTLTVTSNGSSDEITQTVTIESPGGVPTGQNILAGGDMNDPDAWNVTAGADVVVNYEFTDDGLVISGEVEDGTLAQLHIWQPIEVEAGQEYLFFADVSGGGFDNAYLEVVIGPTEPVDGENYAPTFYEDPDNPQDVPGLQGIHPKNSKVAGINFWIDGGGVESFDGNILDEGIATDPEGLASKAAGENSTNGRITFPTSGTYYLLLKAGSWEGSMGPQGVTIYTTFLAPIVE